MSDLLSRRTFLSRAIIGSLLALPVATYTANRWWAKKNSLSGGAFEVVPLPIPDEVSGPFRTQACVSHDSKTLLLGGRPAFSSGVARVIFKGGSEEDVMALVDSLGQSLYITSWPPQKKDDYRCVVQIPEITFIRAMSLSPVAPLAAFLSRECWAERDYPERFKKLIDKTVPLWDVLYTVPLEGGKPVPLAVFPDSFSRKGELDVLLQEGVEATLRPTSICWDDRGESIYCHIKDDIVRVQLNGQQKKVFKTRGSILSSPLQFQEGSLSLILYPWKDFPKNLGNVRESPSLLKLDADGGILSQKKLTPFTSGFDGCLLNSVFDRTDWAALTPLERDDYRRDYSLSVMPFDPSGLGNSQEVISSNSPKYHTDLCHFFQSSREVLLTQFGNLSNQKQEVFSKFIDDGGAGFSRFFRVKVG